MNAQSQITLKTVVAGIDLRLRSLRMVDAMSQPFEITLDLASADFDLDFGKLLGSPFGIAVKRPDGVERFFHGLVAHIELAGSSERLALYRATLRPWLWFLDGSVDSRIFQNKSVPDILKDDVFKHRHFEDIDVQLTGTYAPRGYCVQYAESDFSFASRLLEDSGIGYYFRHERDKHVLVLCDSPKAHKPADGFETIEYRPQRGAGDDRHPGIAAITEWHDQGEVVPGSVVLADRDFTKPRVFVGESAAAPSASARQQQRATFAQFEYPAGAADKPAADAQAKVRREALQAGQRRFGGRGNAFGIGVGHVFTLSRHRRGSLNREYLVTGATTTLRSQEAEQGSFDTAPSFRLDAAFTAIASDQPFRPPRLTPWPRMRGPQTAVVTGPASSEIHTDEFGRVKVSFFWDREGKADDTSSCWVRVAQASAGKGWGHIVLPRVGEEVVVDFLHGDADRPIVTGRVFNGDRPLPYELPAQKTRSGWKTRSTPNGGDDNFNELRFDDKQGEEEIYVHAERDFNRVVENNDSLTVGFDKKQDGNQTVAVYNNQSVEVGTSGCKDGSQTTKVWKHRTTTLQTGDDSLSVAQGSRSTKVFKDDNLTVQTGNLGVKVEAGAYTLEAARSITFKVGGNSITIDPSGITIKALQVKVEGQTGVKVEGLQVGIKATTALDLAGLCTKVDSQAMLAMSAALVKIN